MTELAKRFCGLRRKCIERDFARMNDRQLEAVTCTEGPLLILAGAGSGKTTVLVNRIANLVRYGAAYDAPAPEGITQADCAALEAYLAHPAFPGESLPAGTAVRPARPWEILAITFTNKAAGELKERIGAMLGEEALDVWAGTFHATCSKILRRYGDRLGYTSHFTIYDTDDQRRLMKEVQKQLKIDDKLLPHKAILSAVSGAKDALISPAEYAGRAGSDYRLNQIAKAYGLYQQLLKEADAMDFDDIIVNAVELFRQNPDVLDYYQNKFRYIMVDEYQDTNHAQYMLVKLLADKHRNICVVGDDDQSIYRFRGATIENILSFEKQYPGAKVIRLEQNYRSTKTILQAANAVIAHNAARKGKSLWTENEDGAKIDVHTAADEQDEARYVADRILDDVREGKKFSDHAILYRMNAQSNALENVFVRSGIPYRIIGGFRFYDRKEVKDVIAYLNVINNPADSLRMRRIINEPKRGIGDATVAHVAQIAEGLGVSMFQVMKEADAYPALSRAAKKLREFAGMLQELIEAAERLSIHELLELTLDKSGYMRALAAQGEEAKDRIDNVNELSSSILQYEQENEEPTLSGFLEEVSLITDIDAYDTGDDRVVLMTLHSAKGLEFPVVFLVGMEEGIFPGNQSIYGGPEEIEEERRLAYVGITRARQELIITNAGTRMLYGSTSRNRPSRFLNEMPETCLNQTGRPAAAAFSAYMQNMRGGVRDNLPFGSGGELPERYFQASPGQGMGGTYGRKNPAAGFVRKAPAAASMESVHVAGQASPSAGGAGKTAGSKSGGLAVGDRVLHKAFGQGIVRKATPMGNDTLLEIQFEKAGVKKIMQNFAKLEKI
ncbi:MAG TPA: UvrD-helicase domain-containing protein [Firmicutes bacterium]|nr:UvrD-helicase domain-containing protein [Bacillota bacterium]